MSKQDNNTEKETAVEKRKPTATQRFTNEVKRQFQSSLNQKVDLTEHQKQLMKNMFIKIDSALEEQEARRQQRKKGGTPITWKHVDMQKLALDAMHRIRLGLDALISNHIHAIPYFNSKTEKYDLDLRIGYKGKLYYRKEVAKYPVKSVRLELVHENDEFSQIKKDDNHEKDTYTFQVKKPFDRGEVVGGFGYIEYEDESRNEVVTVPLDEFNKIKEQAPTNKFWGPWEQRMQMKTLAHRTAEEIEIDPEKVNKSYHYVEAQDNPYQEDMEVKIDQPKAEDRKSIDIGMDQGNGQQQEAEEVEFEEKPERASKQASSNGAQQPDQPADNEAFDELLAEVNELGKQIYKSKWFSKSKEYLPSDAEYLTDLDMEGLENVKAALEDKAKAEA